MQEEEVVVEGWMVVGGEVNNDAGTVTLDIQPTPNRQSLWGCRQTWASKLALLSLVSDWGLMTVPSATQLGPRPHLTFALSPAITNRAASLAPMISCCLLETI